MPSFFEPPRRPKNSGSIFEPCIAIRRHPALILCKMIFGVLPFAIWRELILTCG